SGGTLTRIKLGVVIRLQATGSLITTPSFIRVKVPPLVPRLVPVGDSGTEFTLLEELIAANTEALFPGVQVGVCHAFRVTRDADIEIREDEAGDLLHTMERELR